MNNESLKKDLEWITNENHWIAERMELEIEAWNRMTVEKLKKQKEKYIKKMEVISKQFSEILSQKLEEHEIEASMKITDLAKQVWNQ